MMQAFWLMLFLCAAATCAADPLAGGDSKIGKTLVEKNCIACHAKTFGGDGSKIYTRAERKVTSTAKLVAQVANCNANLGLQWFPEDEVHAATYLNDAYYKLK
jgi:mono/diheme cytochrome c family protein